MQIGPQLKERAYRDFRDLAALEATIHNFVGKPGFQAQELVFPGDEPVAIRYAADRLQEQLTQELQDPTVDRRWYTEMLPGQLEWPVGGSVMGKRFLSLYTKTSGFKDIMWLGQVNMFGMFTEAKADSSYALLKGIGQAVLRASGNLYACILTTTDEERSLANALEAIGMRAIGSGPFVVAKSFHEMVGLHTAEPPEHRMLYANTRHPGDPGLQALSYRG